MAAGDDRFRRWLLLPEVQSPRNRAKLIPDRTRGPIALLKVILIAVLAAVLVAVLLRLRGRRRSHPRIEESPPTKPPPTDGIVAFVWSKKAANSDDLRAMGQVLGAWRLQHPQVTRIDGLDDLLEGRYPPPDGPTQFVESPDGELMPVPVPGGRIEYRKMAVVNPWSSCPALVWAGEGLSSTEAQENLQ